MLEVGTAVVTPQKRLWEIIDFAGNRLNGRQRRGGNVRYDLLENFNWKLIQREGHDCFANFKISSFCGAEEMEFVQKGNKGNSMMISC